MRKKRKKGGKPNLERENLMNSCVVVEYLNPARKN